MRLAPRIACALAGLIALPGAAVAGTIGGTFYATQYDYREFFAATDGKKFQVVLAGNPFPGVAGDEIRFRPNKSGRFYVYAMYCRNDRAMSQTTAWTDAAGPTDPRIERLFRELFPVVFSEQQNHWSWLDTNIR